MNLSQLTIKKMLRGCLVYVTVFCIPPRVSISLTISFKVLNSALNCSLISTACFLRVSLEFSQVSTYLCIFIYVNICDISIFRFVCVLPVTVHFFIHRCISITSYTKVIHLSVCILAICIIRNIVSNIPITIFNNSICFCSIEVGIDYSNFFNFFVGLEFS